MKKNKGFTLIELMVVISIIGMLSSVVLASVNNARFRSRDIALQGYMKQIANLMALERTESSNFSNLNRGWVDTCNPVPAWSGRYNSEIQRICQIMITMTEGTLQLVYIGAPQSSNNSSYTIMARMPYQSRLAGANRYACLGANGKTSTNSLPGTWTGDGCWSDPTNQ